MAAEPLKEEFRAKLSQLFQTKAWRKTAKEWGIDRGTLAEAAQGLPKQASVRYLIENKLKEAETKAGTTGGLPKL